MNEIIDWILANRMKLQEQLKYYAPKFVWGYLIGMIGTAKELGFLRMPLFLLSYVAYFMTMITIRVNYDVLFTRIPSDERTWLQLKLSFVAIGCGWAAYVIPRYL